MKTQKEIEQLAKAQYSYDYVEDTSITDMRRNGFEDGYIQCQKDMSKISEWHEQSSAFGYEMGYTKCQEDMADKKYTEEDIRKVIDETIKACNISQKESYGDLEIDTDKIINSLNKQD